jgi:CheY-like chemotaxis protein
VILDVFVPPNGVQEILEEMLAIRPNLPVVLTSGDVLSAELRERLAAVGGIFLGKPFVPKSLLEALDDVIARAAS